MHADSQPVAGQAISIVNRSLAGSLVLTSVRVINDTTSVALPVTRTDAARGSRTFRPLRSHVEGFAGTPSDRVYLIR
jgi:hypothetical protein